MKCLSRIFIIKGDIKLKICIIGDVEGNHDEGMKNTAYNIYKELKKNGNDVFVIKSKKSCVSLFLERN